VKGAAPVVSMLGGRWVVYVGGFFIVDAKAGTLLRSVVNKGGGGESATVTVGVQTRVQVNAMGKPVWGAANTSTSTDRGLGRSYIALGSLDGSLSVMKLLQPQGTIPSLRHTASLHRYGHMLHNSRPDLQPTCATPT
jgi:hypothetical protein